MTNLLNVQQKQLVTDFKNILKKGKALEDSRALMVTHLAGMADLTLPVLEQVAKLNKELRATFVLAKMETKKHSNEIDEVVRRLTAALDPDMLVEVKLGRKKDAPVRIIKASECRTADDFKAANRQIRDAHGAPTRTPKKKPAPTVVVTPGDVAAKLEELVHGDAEILAMIAKWVGQHGYTTPRKRTIKVKKVAAPMVMPKDITALNIQAG